MTTAPDVDALMKRTVSSWYEDGLADIALGGYFLVLAAFLLGQSLTPPGSPLWLLWGPGTPLVLIIGAVTVGWLVQRLKQRLSFPRTGYISFERRQRSLSRSARIVAVIVLSAAISAGTAIVSARLLSLALIFGLLSFGVFAYLWRRLGLRRYLATALWCLAVGIALTPLPLTMEQGGAAFWALAGLGLAVSGFLAWRRFDRTAPPAEASNAAE